MAPPPPPPPLSSLLLSLGMSISPPNRPVLVKARVEGGGDTEEEGEAAMELGRKAQKAKIEHDCRLLVLRPRYGSRPSWTSKSRGGTVGGGHLIRVAALGQKRS